MRKVTFFTLVFLSWTGIANSQVVSFPESDAIWKEEYITIAGPFSRHFGLCGDTLINGTTYNQMVAFDLDMNGEVAEKTFTMAIRSEGPKVWVLPDGFNNEVLLYDFSLQANEQILLLDLASGSQVTRTVDSVKVENIAGADRRVIYFKPDLPGETGEFWIQGFGSNYGVLWRAYLPAADLGFALLCFQHGEEYLNLTAIECFLPAMPDDCETINAAEAPVAAAPLKLTATPNPAGSEIRFTVNQTRNLEAYSLKIYAANGKLLKTVDQVSPETKLPQADALKPGFYIAVLETKKGGRVVAHCTFVSGS
jgi:hypothetical protein